MAKRVALVTGGNKGIGFEIAKALAAKGFTTVLGSRDGERGEQAAASLRAAGLEHVSSERLDLTDAGSWAECVAAIEAKHGRLDVLCNNAAICFNDPTLYGKVEHTPFEGQADITVRTNFTGTLGFTRACLPLLRASPSPRVINIASAAGRLSILRSPEKAAAVASPRLTLAELEGLLATFVADVQAGVHAARGWPGTCYGMSKVGIIAMTRAFARDEPTIMFNAVDPGYCATDQNMNQGTLPAATGAQTPTALACLELEEGGGGFRTGCFFSHTGTEIDWLQT
jgi:carbonyl reductase 1